jgi:hypothetical protein
MLGFSVIAGLAVLLPSVFASPVAERSTALDTTYHCNQWDTITAGQVSSAISSFFILSDDENLVM